MTHTYLIGGVKERFSWKPSKFYIAWCRKQIESPTPDKGQLKAAYISWYQNKFKKHPREELIKDLITYKQFNDYNNSMLIRKKR